MPRRGLSKGTEKALALAAQRGVTEAGKIWLTEALDPFHDTSIDVVGYPDPINSSTLVYEINQSIQLTAPTGIVSTDTWSAHIFNLPELQSNNLISDVARNIYAYQAVPASTNVAAMGLLNVVSWTSSVTTSTFDLSANNQPQTINSTPSFRTYQNSTVTNPQNTTGATNYWGASRVVGLAFEIENTSSDLNKQGTTTCYRMPQVNQVGMTAYSSTAIAASWYFPSLTCTSKLPPVTVTDALQLDGSSQWDAADGAYVVCTQASLDNPLVTPQPMNRQFGYTVGSAYTGMSNTGSAWVGNFSNSATAALSYNASMNNFKPIPFNTSGVFLTGLSPNSTFNVRLRIIMERAPSFDEGQIANFANKSPPYDPIAFEIYSRAIYELPVGVGYNENPLGEWFKKVVSAVRGGAEFLTPVIPQAQIVAQVAKAIQGITASKGEKQQVRADKKQAKKKNKAIKAAK